MNEPSIVFEDEHLLVLNKPAGWVVNEAESTKNQLTVQKWLREKFSIFNNARGQYPNIPISQYPDSVEQYNNEEIFAQRCGIVHRLDKETSGILLIAKTPEAFMELQRQFKERETKKTYLALVHGEVKPSEGIIEAPISRNPFNPKRFGVFPGGKPAKTVYRVLNKIRSLSFLELKPFTGRTHQIRVHLKHIGHPVVSDELYAGRQQARSDRLWCPRLFLHASSIEFYHPTTKKPLIFSVELPEELKKALEFSPNLL